MVLGALGSGGVGQVFRAEDTRTKTIVALKLLREEWRSSPRELERFRREAEAAKLVSHPNCVRLLDSGVANDEPFVVYELVEGVGLDERLRIARGCGQRLPLASTLALGQEIASALAALHAEGLFHRDVKPANIRIRDDGRVVLLDFGLVRGVSLETLTRTGEFAGSLPYAAPEQVESGARDVDARADLYSLAATLYECFTGLPVFTGTSMEQVIVSIVNDDPLPAHRIVPTLPRAFDVVLQKALEKDPAHRYSTMREFADDLRALASGSRIAARSPTPLRRLTKLARRRPGAAATIVAAVLLLTVVPGLLYIQESIAERRLQEEVTRTAEQQARAEENLARSIEALSGIVARASDPTLRAHAGTEPVRRQMLEDARKCFDTLIAANIQNTDLAIGSARALRQLAALCVDLGDLDAGETAYRSAVERMRVVLASYPNDATYHHDLADGLNGLSTIFQLRGDTTNTECAIAESLAERDRAHDLEFDSIWPRRETDSTLARIAITNETRNNDDVVDTIASIESRLAANPGNDRLERSLGVTLLRLALEEDRNGNDAAADSAYARALEIQERLAARSPEMQRHTVDYAITLASRGDRRFRQGQIEAARADYLEAEKQLDSALARSPANLDWAQRKASIDQALTKTRNP